MATLGTKSVKVLIGESLRTIALRELGDAMRWVELADINNLRPPYIVESINGLDRLKNTVIWGDSIIVPIGTAAAISQSPVDILGKDVELSGGEFMFLNGDLSTLSGADNLRQALKHRINTDIDELITHPDYGCNASVAIGMGVVPIVAMMLAGYIQRALKQEPRIATIDNIKAASSGDAINIDVSVTSVGDNTAVDLNLVFATR